MKSISIVNLFTSVIFLIVTSFSHVGFGQSKMPVLNKDGSLSAPGTTAASAGSADAKTSDSGKTEASVTSREQCESDKNEICSAPCPSKPTESEKSSCYSSCSAEAKNKCKGYPSQAQLDKEDKKCETAFEEYKKNRKDTKNACLAIENPNSGSTPQDVVTSILNPPTTKSAAASIDMDQSCSNKISQCRAIMKNSLTVSEPSEMRDNSMVSSLLMLATQGATTDPTQQQTAQQNLSAANIPQCITDFDNKDLETAQEKFRDRREKLEKEKEQLQKDFDKEVEEQNKKSTDIAKDLEKLESDNKEKIRKIDVDLREKSTQESKASIEASRQLRDINNKIVAKQVELKKIQFAYATKLASETAENTNLRCQAVFDTAKECMYKAAKNKLLSDAEKAKCQNFPNLVNKKGAKATAEIKSKLKYINEQCFIEAETSKKNQAFAHQETIDQINRDIVELNSSLQDAQNNQSISSKNLEAIKAEAQKEKDENAASLAKQTQNLNTELTNFINASNAKMQKLSTRMEEILKKLEELEFEQKTKSKSAIAKAESLIQESNDLVETVMESCSCSAMPNKPECSQVRKTDPDKTPERRSSRSRTNRAK